MLIDILFSIVLLGLWSAVLITDLRTRRIPIPVLLILTVAVLIGHAWPWWLLAVIALGWPFQPRTAVILVPVAITIGVLTAEPVIGIGLAIGVLAWSLNWWGGADAVALLVLALRSGSAGVLGAGAACLLVSLLIMLRRRRSLSGLRLILVEAVALEPQAAGAIPSEAELPAAAVLAVVGMALEIMRWFASA